MIAPINNRRPYPKLDTLKDIAAFQKMDKNHDGGLSRAEYVGKPQGRCGTMMMARWNEFRRYDTNKDGKLSMKEFLDGRRRDRMKIVPMPQPVSVLEGSLQRVKDLVFNRAPQAIH